MPPKPAIFVKKGPGDYGPGPMIDGVYVPPLDLSPAAVAGSTPREVVRKWVRELQSLPKPPAEILFIDNRPTNDPHRPSPRALVKFQEFAASISASSSTPVSKKGTPSPTQPPMACAKKVGHVFPSSQSSVDSSKGVMLTPTAQSRSSKKVKQELHRQNFLQKANQSCSFKVELIQEILTYLRMQHPAQIPVPKRGGKPSTAQDPGNSYCTYHLHP